MELKDENTELQGNSRKELEKKIWEELSQIEDPEIGIGIVELGLIYTVKFPSSDSDHSLIRMTFTSMGCPYGPQLRSQVREAALKVVSEVEVDVVFQPVWDPKEMASEDAKMALGIY